MTLYANSADCIFAESSGPLSDFVVVLLFLFLKRQVIYIVHTTFQAWEHKIPFTSLWLSDIRLLLHGH